MTESRIGLGARGRQALGVAVLASLAATAALAAELPAFRRGMWEFQRSIAAPGPGSEQAAMASKKCTDPSADMKRMNAMLTAQGCTISELTAKGNVYTFSSQCQLQGISSQTRSVITVESDSAYTVQVTGTTAGKATNELLKARRVGDC
ncbi:MAG: DUF3617 family protein [Burkholderiaceae bacterium]